MAQPPILYGTAAGGSLAGSYPNPTLAPGSVLRENLGVASVGANEIEDHSLTADKLASGISLGTVITVPENIDSGVITPAHLAVLTTYVRTQGNQVISGDKAFERLLLWHWPTQAYDVTNKWYVDSMILSGGGANPNLEAYASGTRTLNVINQSNITLITSYASGIETLRRAMSLGTNPALEAYASGTRNTQIIIQNNQTSINNTLSGVITDVREIEIYASGIGARPSGGTSTATGSSIRQTYTQSHSFTNLNAIYMRTDGIWDKAKADNINAAESIGIIESTSGNQFTVVFEGELANQSGLLPGFVYFLSASTAGAITATEPVTSGTISKPVMVAISSDKGIVTSYRGILNGVSGSSTGGDTTILESYASGIETMRRAMTGSSYDDSGIKSYTSGVNNQLILVQNNCVSTDAILSSNLSGIKTLATTLQTNLNSTNSTVSGINSSLIILNSYTSGTKTLVNTIQANDTILTAYASGIQALNITDQNLMTVLTNYASGTKTLVNTLQVNQTASNSTVSGINSSLIILNSYASGTRNTQIIVQNNLTSVTNTTSGIITDIREIESYESGNKILLLAHADRHRENGVDELGAQPFNGFVNRTDSTLSTSGNGVVISPASTTFSIYSNGIKYTKNSAQSAAILQNNKQYFIYFDNTGNIQTSLTAWDIESDNVPTMTAYKSNNIITIGEERHGYKRNRAFHAWAHNTIGARYDTGLAGTFADSGFSIESGTIRDEDLILTTTKQTACRMWYRTNAGAEMTFVSGTTILPYYYTGGNMYYDNAGTLSIVGSNLYVCNYVYSTNDTVLPTYVIVGQNTYTTIAAAENDPLPSLANLLTAEWKLLYRAIYRNTGSPTFIEAVDLRNVSNGPPVNMASTSHTALSDRSLADQHPITAITGLENQLSGINTLAITGQNNINLITNYASGIETLRRAMVSTGSNPALEAYASGTNVLAKAQTPRDVDFWLRSRDRVDVTGGVGLSFNNNDFSQEVLSNPGLLTGYDITLNTKYADSISGVNSNLVNTQSRVTTLENAGGGTGNSVKQTIIHDSEKLVFRAVYKDSNNAWQYSKANSPANAEIVGIVESTSGNSSTIVTNGKISNSNIYAGLVYYLSQSTDGGLEMSEPSNLSKPCLIGIDSGIGIVQIFRGLVVSGTSTTPLSRGYIDGFITSPYCTSGVQVNAGVARDDGNNFNIVSANTNIKKLTGPWVAGTQQNGIDSGNRAANTWYHVHEITNGNSIDTIFSTSATSPTLPLGYVASRRIASIKTDSTGYVISYFQNGDKFTYTNPIFDVNGGTWTNTRTLVTISTPLGVVTSPLITVLAIKTGAAISLWIGSPSVADIPAALGVYKSYTPATSQATFSLTPSDSISTDKSSQIATRSDTATVTSYLTTHGYVDSRGKDS